MNYKSVIISGAVALTLLIAPATPTQGATPDHQVQEQKHQNIKWVTQFVTQYSYSVNGNKVNWEELSAQLNKYINPSEDVKKQEAPKTEEQPIEQAPEKVQPKPQETEAPAPEPQQPEAKEVAQPTKEQVTPKETTQTDQVSEVSSFEDQVVQLTNAERNKQGLAPLTLDIELSKVAEDKSKDMQQNNYFSHTSPTYGSPFDMMKSYGINYKSAGENIAMGQRSPEEVVQAWMNSEGHRKNIMSSSFTHIGVGHIEEGNYWTQMFISK